MTKTEQLMEVAQLHGIEVPPGANFNAINKLLKDNEVYVGDEIEKTPQAKPKKLETPQVSYNNLDHTIRELEGKIKLAESNRDLKRLETHRKEIRSKLGNEKTPTLIRFLRLERKYKLINVPDNYLLNKFEAEAAKGECECIEKTPTGLHAELGQVYPCDKYYDESREKDVYRVFIKRIIPPESQIDGPLAWDIQHGFRPEKEQFAKPKEVWHAFPLVEDQFEKYFEVITDLDEVDDF